MVVMEEVPKKLQATHRLIASRDVAIFVKTGKDLRYDLVNFLILI